MMIATIKWVPPTNYGFLFQLDNEPILNFDQRKKITYLGAFGVIAYLLYLSCKLSQKSVCNSI